MTPSEEWRAVVGYEGRYEVSDQGRVRSVTRLYVDARGRNRHLTGVVLTPHHRNGYLAVSLHLDGAIKTHNVHLLVAAAFLGPRPEGLEVCHGNGDPSDARLSNLRYDTVSANRRDTVAHGRDPQANQTHCKRGHEFTPENTYRSREGWRYCRTCRAANFKRWRANNRPRKR